MIDMAKDKLSPKTLNEFLQGKSDHTVELFNYLIKKFRIVGPVQVLPAKTMIGLATPRKRIAYITQLGRTFVHVIFPFAVPHTENLCFQKIAQVPGDAKQYNHHLRLFNKEDINDEVMRFIKLAWQEGS